MCIIFLVCCFHISVFITPINVQRLLTNYGISLTREFQISPLIECVNYKQTQSKPNVMPFQLHTIIEQTIGQINVVSKFVGFAFGRT